MPFRPPFSTACEGFLKNTSRGKIKLIKRVFYHFILNQAKAFLPNPFRRGFPLTIGRIQRYHTLGGANGTTMVVMIVGYLCLGRRYFPYYSYWCGASLGGAVDNIPNPTLRLFSHTCLHISRTRLHTRSDDNQTRRYKKH